MICWLCIQTCTLNVHLYRVTYTRCRIDIIKWLRFFLPWIRIFLPWLRFFVLWQVFLTLTEVFLTLTKVYLNLTEAFLTLTEVSLTLTDVFPCFFLSCRSNARVKLAKTGHGPHSSKLVVCAVLLLFTLFVCKCVLYNCATSRRVPRAIHSHWGFFPGHQTVPCALGSTQPLKMSTRIFLGGKDGWCVRVTTLPPSCAECLEILEP